ncbi:hypothetical protein C8R21_10190 [Nitrosospira multiformis]|jgi:hypothetical protein|uniref:Uncharacterized protein n=2 Tax=Nitrosospira multiformis TaxID=1231 RepID=A0A2T5IHT6_9PROT|nr:hypothetical protein C8R21_10190 [Nitrosospira multiformis]
MTFKMDARQTVSTEHHFLHSVPKVKTLLALFGAPGAWVTQMALTQPIAAYACYPHQFPLSAPLWPELPAILATIGFVCLAGALFSGYIALGSWRSISRLTKDPLNKQPAIQKDEGQARFLAMLGMMSSFVFIVAILFNTFAVLLIRSCSAWI